MSLELVREIKKLPPIERVRIVDIVIRDVLPADPDIDRVWTQEALSRWDTYKKGDIKSIPYEEVMSRYKRP
ncbi:addiction module protein [bacterium]|nr:addiction module protein [bacterium]MBU1754630.1 addiction module protein [bacterium]